MKSEVAIKVDNLVAKYGSRTVLDGINFEVSAGDIFMIIGSSGSGKTTLLGQLLGLLRPFSGEILIDHASFTKAGDEERSTILKKIGVLYQSGALFGSLNLFKNVALPLEEQTNLPKEAIFEIALSKLKMVGLDKFYYYLPDELSGGMRKRAGVARAMALDPKIIFLDEPASGLDPISAAELDYLIADLSRILKTTFVIVSHHLPSVFRIAKKVILLHNGKIIAQGEPGEVSNSPHPFVKKFFNS